MPPACPWTTASTRRSGLRTAPPFAVVDPIRGRRGLTVDLWVSIERELRSQGLVGRTELVDCPLGAQLEALAEGRLDR